MSTMKITKEVSYFSKRNITSISDYKKCLEKFSKNFDQEIRLATESPIFLDTNILLRYYNISITAREKLYQFIEKNSKRIIISKQVQTEFLRNREDSIRNFFNEVTDRIPKAFKSDVISKMKSFIESNKDLLKDYPFVEIGVQKSQTEMEKLLIQLNENVQKDENINIDLILKDKFLDLLNTCILDIGLEEDELTIVKDDFNKLAMEVKGKTTESVLNKTTAVFPGFGDIKEKPENPYGDYIIIHEIMKYGLKIKKDLVLLTLDNKKGDWMSKSKSPHLHYVQNHYLNTNSILYIVDAERTLEDILNINIESLVSDQISQGAYSTITEESLRALIENNKIFIGLKPGIISQSVVMELFANGYHLIADVESDLTRGELAILEYMKDAEVKFDTVMALKACLRIVNSTYTLRIIEGGALQEIHEKHTSKYKKYRSLIF